MLHENAGWWDEHTTQVLDVLTRWGWIRHLIIRRRDDKEILLPWSTIQAIKDDVLGDDVTAVEMYPTNSAVVNEANWRHLWTMPLPLSFDLFMPNDSQEE